MPYARSLQQYTTPGMYAEPPRDWQRRLDAISPDLPNLDKLVFRYFDGHVDGNDSWACQEAIERGVWVLYSAKPIKLVEKDRAKQFEKHWSELQEIEQAGRSAVVSDYQHFMWHSRGLYVRPFLILQGPFGGTPAKYTHQEKCFLKASNCEDEPFDIGTFPPCPFDGRVEKQITLRDRLLQQSNSYGALEELDSSEGIGREFDEGERVQRETWLDTHAIMIQPAVEYYKFLYSTKKSSVTPEDVLPPAPEGLANTLATWRESYIETGIMPGVTPARQRTLHDVSINVQ